MPASRAPIFCFISSIFSLDHCKQALILREDLFQIHFKSIKFYNSSRGNIEHIYYVQIIQYFLLTNCKIFY